MIDLVNLCAGLIGFAVFMYVLLDGFDLGIGILFPFFPSAHERGILQATILPVWDGNQTWLVFGTSCLYGAFPQAFAILLTQLYAPLFTMLLALMLRGVAFEFRLKSSHSITQWDRVFFIGSLIATLSQGVLLGTFVSGFNTTPALQSHSNFVWMHHFNIAAALGTVCGYSLLACGWLILKTTGDIQKKARYLAWRSLAFVGFFMLLFSAWTPFLSTFHWQRWLAPETLLLLSSIPLMTLAAFGLCAFGLYKQSESLPFLAAMLIFLCGATGVCVSIYPYIVPQTLTFHDTAAPQSSLQFMLIGVVFMLPFLLVYTAHAYYVFRGKVTQPIHYG